MGTYRFFAEFLQTYGAEIWKDTGRRKGRGGYQSGMGIKFDGKTGVTTASCFCESHR